MPRSARIDIPGLLQHVMVRGIEGRDIFLDDDDKALFLDRLSKLLVATGTECLAWALMSNHFHLLLRPHATKLSLLMRRLLTGYAVTFNLRHNRKGHLFQNRYKSIVCEEDSYLLELVRYIHLNPLRAGLVDSVADLETWRWSGHAVIAGKEAFPGQSTEEVLLMFDTRKKKALEKYRAFLSDGAAQGKRDELAGGGLRRYLKLSGSQEYEAFDERILGCGDFVQRLLQETEPAPSVGSLSIEELIGKIAGLFSLDASTLSGGSKVKEFAEARGVVCFVAARKMGINGAVIARALNITHSGVVVAARRGERIFQQRPELRDIVR